MPSKASAVAAPTRRLYVAEPAPGYRTRTPLVVDCSAVATSLFEEAEAPHATQALCAHELHAPSLLAYEFANVARTKSRAGGPAERVAMALRAYAGLRIELHPVDPAGLHALSLLHGLTAYDAAYLFLALMLRAPLLTFDRRLAEAMTKAQGNPR